MGYLYIAGCVFFTVYSQVVLKWRLEQLGDAPADGGEKFIFLIKAVFDPVIFSCLVVLVPGAICWMAALTKFNLSYAYPFMSIAFVLVLILSTVLLHEALDAYKVLGMVLIVSGIFVTSRSMG